MFACSVIVRTKNRNLLLKRALRSIAEQEYIDWQIILINDGGDINALKSLVSKFLNEYEFVDSKVLIIHNKDSKGMEAASNIGIKNSESTYIAFLDDDDTWSPGFLLRCIAYLENRPLSIIQGVATQTYMQHEDILGGEVVEGQKLIMNPSLHDISLFDLSGINKFSNNSFVYFRSAMDTVGLYDENLPVLGDWDFNLRFVLNFEIGVIPEPLVNYHIRTNKTSTDHDNTVTVNRDKHLLYYNLILNKYLRQEIKANGMGSIMNLSAKFKSVNENMDKLLDKFQKVNQQLFLLNNQLIEKDKLLVEKDKQLTETANQRIEKDKLLVEKDKQLTETANQLTETANQLTETANQRIEKDKLLVEKDKQLTETAGQLLIKNNQLIELLNSKSWRMTMIFRVFKERWYSIYSGLLKGTSNNINALSYRTCYKLIKKSKLFDEKYYFIHNICGKYSKVDSLEHFIKYGWKDGLNPSSEFNVQYYLESNQDVAEAKINPLIHYILYGIKEGRQVLPKN